MNNDIPPMRPFEADLLPMLATAAREAPLRPERATVSSVRHEGANSPSLLRRASRWQSSCHSCRTIRCAAP